MQLGRYLCGVVVLLGVVSGSAASADDGRRMGMPVLGLHQAQPEPCVETYQRMVPHFCAATQPVSVALPLTGTGCQALSTQESFQVPSTATMVLLQLDFRIRAPQGSSTPGSMVVTFYTDATCTTPGYPTSTMAFSAIVGSLTDEPIAFFRTPRSMPVFPVGLDPMTRLWYRAEGTLSPVLSDTVSLSVLGYYD